ncbi:unnamed protein product, partial [marine sediment metagenome]
HEHDSILEVAAENPWLCAVSLQNSPLVAAH